MDRKPGKHAKAESMTSFAVAILLCSAYGIFLEIWTRRKALAVRNKMPDFASFGVQDIEKVHKIGKNYRHGAFQVVWALCLACFPMALAVHTILYIDGHGGVVFVALLMMSFLFYQVYSLMHYMRLAGVYWDSEVIVWRNWKTGRWESFALKNVVNVYFSRSGRSCRVVVNDYGTVWFYLLSDMGLLHSVARERSHEDYERKMGRFTKVYNRISDLFK